MILLIGSEQDPHVGSVASALTRGGAPFTVLDCFQGAPQGLRYECANDVSLQYGNGELQLSDVTSVWWRQKPKSIRSERSIEDFYNYEFVTKEWKHTWDYLSLKLERSFCLNPSAAGLRANNKLLQLEEARGAGFCVPRTLVTNSADAASEFVRSMPDKQGIFKTLTPYTAPGAKLCFTSVTNENLIRAGSDSLSQAPGIFQEFIKKSFELRITIVGSQCFTAKVHADAARGTEVDWRERIEDDIYEAYELPSGFREQLLALHTRLGLIYGAYDFSIDRDGQPVFLEVNPLGQWLWLERRLQLPISEALASTLIHGSSQ